MGIVAAVVYGALGLALVAAGGALRARRSMADVPFYDPSDATDPEALAQVLGLSLSVLGIATLAFAAVEAFGGADGIVVAAYAVVVLTVALVTALQTRQYE